MLHELKELLRKLLHLRGHLLVSLLGSQRLNSLLFFCWLQISQSLHRKIKIVKLVKIENLLLDLKDTYLLDWICGCLWNWGKCIRGRWLSLAEVFHGSVSNLSNLLLGHNFSGWIRILKVNCISLNLSKLTLTLSNGWVSNVLGLNLYLRVLKGGLRLSLSRVDECRINRDANLGLN